MQFTPDQAAVARQEVEREEYVDQWCVTEVQAVEYCLLTIYSSFFCTCFQFEYHHPTYGQALPTFFFFK